MLAATDRLLIAQGPFAGDAQAKLLGGGPALLDGAERTQVVLLIERIGMRVLRAELPENVDLQVEVGFGRVRRLGPDEVGRLASGVPVEPGVDELDALARLDAPGSGRSGRAFPCRSSDARRSGRSLSATPGCRARG